MPQKTYMYDTQWNQLINAIGTGDSSAVVTALSTIKTSLDNINTQLDTVGFNSTQWTALLNAINTGDSSAVASALNTIKNSLDNITNAISNQTITVDLSDINSDNVLNLSNVTGGNITNAFNNLNSTLNKLQNTYLFRLFIGNEQQITSTSYVDIVTINNQPIKAGKYMCLVSINATWTEPAYQFGLRLKIGDSISDLGASAALPQTNVPINCRTFINIPTDGVYSISIQGNVTDSMKRVTIVPYQYPRLVLIPCINDIVF